MSDSVSGRCTALKNDQKKRNSKEPYNVRKKLVAIEEEEIKAMEQLTRKQFDSKRKKRTFKTISYENVTM